MGRIVLFFLCFLGASGIYTQTTFGFESADGESRNLGREIKTVWSWRDIPGLKKKKSETQPNTTKPEENLYNVSDSQKIRKIIEYDIHSFMSKDIDSAMQHISPNFRSYSNGKVIDYSKFRSDLEKAISDFFSTHINAYSSDLKITELDFKNNKAIVKFKYNINAFNLANQELVVYSRKRHEVYAKENGQWKLIEIINYNFD